MKQKDRYDTSGLLEGQYEPGSRGRVLKNRRGIAKRREMDEIEAREQLRALNEFIGTYDREHRFSNTDICHMHKLWLGKIYAWAGQYRQVNVSKGDFTFAMAKQIPTLMKKFEQGALRNFTPCIFGELETIIHALAVVHTELILIHPFREGNGRLVRMLSILMGLQAGYPPLDFSLIKGKVKKEYIAAVQAGMNYDYDPMEEIFGTVLKRTLRQLKV
ncbi:MAG: Fic family protein [Pseudomonadota bacterium]|nr:Fic family protein [Pseudomonadota bacterium]